MAACSAITTSAGVSAGAFGAWSSRLRHAVFTHAMRRECKGTDICPHDKIKYNCRHCAPPGYFCIHDRFKTRCKECKGGSICSHNRIRSQCKECKGGGICAHGNYKTSCKMCGGGSICEHNRVRSKCKDCGGSQICKHGRERCVRRSSTRTASLRHVALRRYSCRQCKGKGFCAHGKRRTGRFKGSCALCAKTQGRVVIGVQKGRSRPKIQPIVTVQKGRLVPNTRTRSLR